MGVEKAIFRPAPEHANPRDIARFLAEVFAALACRPRRIKVELDFSEADPAEPIVLDLEKGVPILRQAGAPAARVRIGGRWLADHDVPLTLPLSRATLRLDPTNDGRIRVTTPHFALKDR